LELGLGASGGKIRPAILTNGRRVPRKLEAPNSAVGG
jgi:hypothetical protein